MDLSDNGGGYACGACGASFRPNAAELVQLRRAEAAWLLVLEGKAHEDRACAGCNGVLLLERFRLCSSCVETENAKLQGSLFP